MTWLQLALALSQIVLWLIDRAEHSKAVREGEAKAIREAMEVMRARIEAARIARDSVDHGRLPNDDPYRRD